MRAISPSDASSPDDRVGAFFTQCDLGTLSAEGRYRLTGGTLALFLYIKADKCCNSELFRRSNMSHSMDKLYSKVMREEKDEQERHKKSIEEKLRRLRKLDIQEVIALQEKYKHEEKDAGRHRMDGPHARKKYDEMKELREACDIIIANPLPRQSGAKIKPKVVKGMQEEGVIIKGYLDLVTSSGKPRVSLNDLVAASGMTLATVKAKMNDGVFLAKLEREIEKKRNQAKKSNKKKLLIDALLVVSEKQETALKKITERKERADNHLEEWASDESELMDRKTKRKTYD